MFGVGTAGDQQHGVGAGPTITARLDNHRRESQLRISDQPGGDGLMFIVFDEADLSSNGVTQDNRCTKTILNGCGGRVATPGHRPAGKARVSFQRALRPRESSPHRVRCFGICFMSRRRSGCQFDGRLLQPGEDCHAMAECHRGLARTHSSQHFRQHGICHAALR